MIEGSGSGSVPLTNKSGSGRPKTYEFYGSESGTLNFFLYHQHSVSLLNIAIVLVNAFLNGGHITEDFIIIMEGTNAACNVRKIL